jgi:predicted short-subunit dehydrogenase-like oxidoreductase (DUF2520 family)
MKTVIIGSGNVATVLGEMIAAAGHPILEVAGRNINKTAALAKTLGCPYTLIDRTSAAPLQLNTAADLYIVALSDTALETAGNLLYLPGKLVVHTSGAAPLDVLRPVSERPGVIWPVQSIRSSIRPFPPIPLVIDAGTAGDRQELENFAKTLSRQVQYAGDATRLKLHLAANVTNNFTNYLYSLVAAYCRGENLDFALLLPLIRETAERLDRYEPEDSQTGPARRGDRTTIERHLDLLNKHQELRKLYELFTIQIEEHYQHERTGKI